MGYQVGGTDGINLASWAHETWIVLSRSVSEYKVSNNPPNRTNCLMIELSFYVSMMKGYVLA